MANNLNFTPTFSDVYQLELSDPVQGGPGGIANRQAQELGNRTAFLRARLDNLLNTAGSLVKNDKVEGLGSAALRAVGLASGNLMEVGAFGIGADATVITNLSTSFAPGFNLVAAGASGMPTNETGYGHLITVGGVITVGGIGQEIMQLLFTGGRLYQRHWITDSWFPWTFVTFTDEVGAVVAFATQNVPTGYLRCTGAAVSRTTYKHLFAKIGTSFGVGDGTTTFNLPDLRGQFVRGFDHGAGVDTGRVFGSQQADDLIAHKHTLNDVNAGGGALSGFDLAPVTGGSSGSISTANIADYGGTETRPKNVALSYCIKYQ